LFFRSTDSQKLTLDDGWFLGQLIAISDIAEYVKNDNYYKKSIYFQEEIKPSVGIIIFQKILMNIK
jgi:hypothetical protein